MGIGVPNFDLDDLLSLIEREEKQPSFFDRSFYRGFLTALLIFLLDLWSSHQSEVKILSAIEDSEKRVMSVIVESEERLIEEYIGLVDSPPVFVVMTSLNMRTGPSDKHSVIEVLSPNQPVQYIQLKNGWMEIEFFDYVDNVRKKGWVHSSYLKSVEDVSL